MSDESEQAPRRPTYLIIGLVGLWLIGMATASEGLATIEILRNPFSAAFGSLSADATQEVITRALLDGVRSIARVSLPVGLAQVILGALLVAVCTKALFTRRASPSFALQVIAANAALLTLSYVLWLPVRGRIVDAIVTSGIEPRPSAIAPADFDRLVRLKTWWTFRFRLGLELAVLGLGALAVSRRTAREHLARVEPSTSEER
jgi:predicted cation transporter